MSPVDRNRGAPRPRTELARGALRGCLLKKAAAERAARNSVRGGGSAPIVLDGQQFELKDGAVLIAAITSCTNTSNPAVLIGAGLLARNAREAA